MTILPVLDVMAGQVVHGKAGRRDTYRPIVSRLCPGAAPHAIARAFRAQFGLSTLYLADLDAIAGAAPDLGLYRTLLADGFDLWVDAGVRGVAGGELLRDSGVSSVIVGLETLPSLENLRTILSALNASRLVFSLDIKEGVPITATDWGKADAWRIAEQAVATGVTRMIALDLAAVGMGGGPSTLDLCRRLRECNPHLELTTGGGVRGLSDLETLRLAGVDFVLVASALHDGRITSVD